MKQVGRVSCPCWENIWRMFHQATPTWGRGAPPKKGGVKYHILLMMSTSLLLLCVHTTRGWVSTVLDMMHNYISIFVHGLMKGTRLGEVYSSSLLRQATGCDFIAFLSLVGKQIITHYERFLLWVVKSAATWLALKSLPLSNDYDNCFHSYYLLFSCFSVRVT